MLYIDASYSKRQIEDLSWVLRMECVLSRLGKIWLMVEFKGMDRIKQEQLFPIHKKKYQHIFLDKK